MNNTQQQYNERRLSDAAKLTVALGVMARPTQAAFEHLVLCCEAEGVTDPTPEDIERLIQELTNDIFGRL